MINRKLRIWEFYFLREILKVFFLFLFCFFFLYAMIDYSLHMQDFIKDKKLQVSDLLVYYGYQFIKRATLLLPLALMISTIKVLTSFSIHREFMALQVAGLSFKKLMRPFFLVGCLCVAFNFFSMEYFLPRSLGFLDKFYFEHIKQARHEKKSSVVHSLTLKDNTKLIYLSYDPDTAKFFDCIWLKSTNEIWKMKYLLTATGEPIGKYVDHLVRNSQVIFEKKESFEARAFPEIVLQKNYSKRGHIPIESRSLSELFRMGFKEKHTAYVKMELLTQFYYKCVMPLLSLLAVLAPAPFCIRNTRGAPLFFLYAIALFSYIGLFTLMDAAMILGENRLTTPALAILLPFLLSSAPFVWHFARRR
ncbi:MAG: LptF/LptG family permease [Chlamydiales bacterium]